MKSNRKLLFGEVDNIICPLMVGTAVPSNTSSLMTIGTLLKNLNSSIDITVTRLLTVGVS